VFVLQSGGDPEFVVGCLNKTTGIMTSILGLAGASIAAGIRALVCDDERELAGQFPWTQGLASQFSHQLSSALRNAGAQADIDVPSIGVRKDKYGLTPAYPSNNAPYDTMVDFNVRAAAFLPADRVRGERQFYPVVVVLMRVIDGNSGRPRAQRFLIFGPAKHTYPEDTILIESDTGQFDTTLAAMRRDPDVARRVLHEATARLAHKAAESLNVQAR
jgi:hypothetical protein